MSRAVLNCGFIPLVDCAPLVAAREMGFAEEELLDLRLHRQPSWSTIRDQLTFGQLDAAHMLAPMPVAMSMGLGGVPTRIDVLSVLSVNGNVIGVSRELSERMRRVGSTPDFLSATAVGRALISAIDGRLRVGVPFPFSMHAELLYYWLGALGLQAPADLDVRTVPPPQMADAISSGEIDAFCVGEPWGSIAVEQGVADLVLPGCAIWQFAPEKVLAVRHDWAEESPETLNSLMRAIWRAGRWLSDPANRMMISELLARPDYVDVSPEVIDRALTGRLRVSADGSEQLVPRFLEFFTGAATFPWRSQAEWIAERWANRAGLDREEALANGRASFRSDLYRNCLGPIGADLPGASDKVEGALESRTPVASFTGEMSLGPDIFFDRLIFEPSSKDFQKS
ncbi:MAG: CmpA/NrtA family ABC transporter substrate-binding protein [Pseudomonadota bacterium]